jgi:hypothetical protein
MIRKRRKRKGDNYEGKTRIPYGCFGPKRNILTW